jgi:hypothetical protein
MTTARAARPAFDLDRAAGCLVLVNTNPPTGLALLPRHRRDAWLTRLRRRSLDARLAAGEPPERSQLLAVRTAQLVSPASRRRIARRWDALAALARARLDRSHREVANEIQKVADLLRSDQPVGVRGVASAITMLAIAADAVRRPGSGGEDIAASVARTALAGM